MADGVIKCLRKPFVNVFCVPLQLLKLKYRYFRHWTKKFFLLFCIGNILLYRILFDTIFYIQFFVKCFVHEFICKRLHLIKNMWKHYCVCIQPKQLYYSCLKYYCTYSMLSFSFLCRRKFVIRLIRMANYWISLSFYTESGNRKKNESKTANTFRIV